MADSVQLGATVNPQPDSDQINEDFERDPLANGGGDPEDINDARKGTGTENDDSEPQELHTADDLNNDAKED